jgi:hypothetical protein
VLKQKWLNGHNCREFESSFMKCDLVKGKAIPLQALTGHEETRRLRLPDFKTTDT